jgi:hypothetical protein
VQHGVRYAAHVLAIHTEAQRLAKLCLELALLIR